MPKGIKVFKASPEKLSELGVDGWSPWSCEPSSFDWQYDGTETCFVKSGQVTVETDDGAVEIGAGDVVQFEDGLQCRWIVKETIRKVFSFDVDPFDD